MSLVLSVGPGGPKGPGGPGGRGDLVGFVAPLERISAHGRLCSWGPSVQSSRRCPVMVLSRLLASSVLRLCIRRNRVVSQVDEDGSDKGEGLVDLPMSYDSGKT